MPNCFQLTLKGEKEPMTLDKIDEMICEAFNLEVHPKHYAQGWYGTIGFGIAVGKVLGSDALREYCQDLREPEWLLRILKFLEERFTSNAWYETKR